MAELLKRRKRLPEAEVQYYMTQLVEAVRHLHARGVIHRSRPHHNCLAPATDGGLLSTQRTTGDRSEAIEAHACIQDGSRPAGPQPPVHRRQALAEAPWLNDHL
jgi:serine/threonine protein kinase